MSTIRYGVVPSDPRSKGTNGYGGQWVIIDAEHPDDALGTFPTWAEAIEAARGLNR